MHRVMRLLRQAATLTPLDIRHGTGCSLVSAHLQESPVIQVVPPQQASEDEVKGKVKQWIDPNIWQKLYRSVHCAFLSLKT